MPSLAERSLDTNRAVYFRQDDTWHAGMIVARTATQDVVRIIRSETTVPQKPVVIHEEDLITFIQPDIDQDTVYRDNDLDK